jgi:hypothetical protein
MTKFELSDVQNAVAAGVLDAATADRFAEYLERLDQQGNQLADEEQFRLITSFNDIFVTIGIALFLGAVIWLVPVNTPFSEGRHYTMLPWSFQQASAAAIVSWGLAEMFTRRRRMALPSIILLSVFVVTSAFAAAHGFSLLTRPDETFRESAKNHLLLTWAAGSLSGLGAAILHWLRFKVPITVAAGAAALAGLILSILGYSNPNIISDYPFLTIMPLGLVILALALWYDSTDRLRLTRRTDIAFWLHLLAAPLIVHPIVYPLTTGAGLTTSSAFVIICLFLIMSLLALIIDRRALLVSSLTYFGYAAYQMIKLTGLQDQSSAIATLIVGATVLLLSIGWQHLRRIVLRILPSAIQHRVPPTVTNKHKS